MYFDLDPYHVQVQAKYRRERLTQEYQTAQAWTAQATKWSSTVVKWVGSSFVIWGNRVRTSSQTRQAQTFSEQNLSSAKR